MPLPEGIIPSLNSSEIGALNPGAIFTPFTSTAFPLLSSSYNNHILYSNEQVSLPLDSPGFYVPIYENITSPPYETVENSLFAGSISIDGKLIGGSNIDQTDVITGQREVAVNIDQLDLAPSPQVEEAVQQTANSSVEDEDGEGLSTLNLQSYSPFESGIFTVRETGEFSFTWLFDGGGYQNGQLAWFSLQGMEFLEPGSRLFIQEAARRASSNSEEGGIIFDDKSEGSQFSGVLGTADSKNLNTGEYQGAKTFKMLPGETFALMLVPNGKVQDVYKNPSVEGAKRPLFSLATANPNDVFHTGQLADVVGDGTTFVMEDLRVDTGSDRDYNDWIFKVQGAIGYAALLKDVINPNNQWQYSELGQQVLAHVSTNDNPDKSVPGKPIRDPILPTPVIPSTSADQGSNNLTAPTLVESSPTQDIIDQVSSTDPTDIYQIPIQNLIGAQIEVLQGQITVNYSSPSGQLLGSQVISEGKQPLTLPDGISEDVLFKVNNANGTTATYVLPGFESKAPEPFDIQFEFGDGLTDSQRTTIESAARSTELIIKQGLPSAIVDGKIIDDLNVKLSLADLDGSDGTLAQTKIDVMRYGTLLPAQSTVQLDKADITNLEQSDRLFSVVQHELLHALGFGNLWEAKGLVGYAKTPFARYTGQSAIAAFQAAGGAANYISLENNGDGSADLHWDKNLFQDEVMTKDLAAQGTTTSISSVTVASLADLGYKVNLSLATPNWTLIPQPQHSSDSGFTEEEKQQLALLIAQAEAQPISDIPTIAPTVDANEIAPTIWAHAERFDKDGEYYDWELVTIKPGDTISQYVYDRMANHPSSDNRSRVVKANDPAYWAFISTRNGFPDPNWIVAGDSAWLPVWHPNYEQEQEEERKRREAELKQKEEEEKRQREKLEEAYRQSGQGGLEWYVAKPLPDFSTSAPYETSIRDLVGSLVPDDYFRFTLSRNGRVTLYLEDLLADADLYLYDSRNRLIGKSTRSGLTDEKLVLDLTAGTYLVRVNSPGGVTTDYNLKMLFQGQLTRSQMGPPVGWQPGTGSTSGNTGPRPTFSDPRIERVFTTARDKFANEQWAQAQPQINSLEAQKQQKQRELDQLLAQAIAEQKAKVNIALDGVRNDLQGRVFGGASSIQNAINGVADSAINAVNGLVPGWLQDKLDWLGLGGLVRSAQDTLRGTVNSARNWLNSQVDWVRDQINGAISQFIEMVKNAYMTGAEINAAIEGASNWLKSKTDGLVNFLNDKIGEFKGRILGGLEWARNIRTPEWARNLGVPDWNLYDHAIVGMVNGVADSARNAVSGVGSIFKGVLDVATPLAQGAVAYIVDQVLGDKTGNLYNEIYGVNQKIANIKSGVEKAINAQTELYKQLLDQFLGGLGQAKDFVVGAIFGGFNSEPSLWQILFDAALPTIIGAGVSIIGTPAAGAAAEIGLSITQGIRDLVAELFKVVPKLQKGEQLTAGDWLGLGAAAVGAALSAVPLAGPYLRSLAKFAGLGKKGATMLAELRKLGGPVVEVVLDALKKSVDWLDVGRRAGDLLEMVLDKGRELLLALSYAMQVFDKNVLGRMHLSYADVGADGLAYQSIVTKTSDTLSLLRGSAREEAGKAASEIKGILDNTVDEAVEQGAKSFTQIISDFNVTGHGHSDHGYLTTRAQHETRLSAGVTPSGRNSLARVSSRFFDAQSEALAVQKAEEVLKRLPAPGSAIPSSLATGIKQDARGYVTFYVDARPELSSFGEAVQEIPGNSGNFVWQDVPNEALFVFKPNGAGTGWELVTYYPQKL